MVRELLNFHVFFVALLLRLAASAQRRIASEGKPALLTAAVEAASERHAIAMATSSFVFCSIPEVAAGPWRQLFLRANGDHDWDDDWTDIAWRDDQNVLFVESPEDGVSAKATMVRDPVTRLLAVYLEDCRAAGNWTRCMAKHPISFGGFILRLEGAGNSYTLPIHLKPQSSFCDLGSNLSNYIVSRYDRFRPDASDLLRKVGLWRTNGADGWGKMGAATFDVMVADDFTLEKVCQFYTKETFDIIKNVYADDYVAFGPTLGYDVEFWLRGCALSWVEREREQLVKGPRTSPGTESIYSFAEPTGCSPTSEELWALASEQKQDPPNPTARFFLHESDAFNFSEVVSCFLSQKGITHNMSNIDEQVPANVAEHLGDLKLLESLKTHPLRTWDEDTADLHIIGSAITVSFLATRSGIGCGSSSDHIRRMRILRRTLEAMPSFSRSGGSNFFIFTTHYLVPHIYTPYLLELLNQGKIIVGTADIGYLNWELYPHVRRVITLPYRSHDAIDEAAASAITGGNLSMSERNTSFIFHGAMDRRGEGRDRAVLRDFGNNIFLSDIRNTSFIQMPNSAARKTAERYIESNFCFVPAGDTATSRRFYDALGAGCIPVVLGDYDAFQKNLPFKKTINWADLVLFGGSLRCAATNFEHYLRWLRRLNRVPSSDLDTLRSKNQAIFYNVLSYAVSPMLVNALLVELEGALQTGA
eukprot:TRINITY_DN9422_c0_g1_i1.p1 TRINITY_DN9422_c0_g1~~TRINITY_DN9422_c0_g1_i1.p1  ORF type:complete len:702 (+),score=81.13 TRINITY_DN9422_c0_g1_i1:88-2193(+)